jgi:HEAT repeat protein
MAATLQDGTCSATALNAFLRTFEFPTPDTHQDVRSSSANTHEPTDSLLAALRSHEPSTRRRSARALTAIANSESAAALIDSLEDEDAGVRWHAAFGLAAIGRPALEPLLVALSTRPCSCWFALGAQRVLRRVAPFAPDLRLGSLIHMLENPQARIAVEVEAYKTLVQLWRE